MAVRTCWPLAALLSQHSNAHCLTVGGMGDGGAGTICTPTHMIAFNTNHNTDYSHCPTTEYGISEVKLLSAQQNRFRVPLL